MNTNTPSQWIVTVIQDIYEETSGVEIAGLFSSEAKAYKAKAKVQDWLEKEGREDYAIFVTPVDIDTLKWYEMTETF